MGDEKVKRHKAVTEGFERVYGPSMGAKVEAPVCSVCGSPMEKVGEVVGLGPDFTQFSASLVAAPRCSECQSEMVPASSTEWRCENPDCSLHGRPFNLGVYPARAVES
jgi:hypothetical protein